MDLLISDSGRTNVAAGERSRATVLAGWTPERAVGGIVPLIPVRTDDSGCPTHHLEARDIGGLHVGVAVVYLGRRRVLSPSSFTVPERLRKICGIEVRAHLGHLAWYLLGCVITGVDVAGDDVDSCTAGRTCRAPCAAGRARIAGTSAIEQVLH